VTLGSLLEAAAVVAAAVLVGYVLPRLGLTG